MQQFTIWAVCDNQLFSNHKGVLRSRFSRAGKTNRSLSGTNCSLHSIRTMNTSVPGRSASLSVFLPVTRPFITSPSLCRRLKDNLTESFTGINPLQLNSPSRFHTLTLSSSPNSVPTVSWTDHFPHSHPTGGTFWGDVRRSSGSFPLRSLFRLTEVDVRTWQWAALKYL